MVDNAQASKRIFCTINDINDNQPVFQGTPYKVNVTEVRMDSCETPINVRKYKLEEILFWLIWWTELKSIRGVKR